MTAIRVLLVDDHAVVREGYRSLLEKQPDIEVAGDVSTADAAVRLASSEAIDVAVIDLNMPGKGGLELIPLLVRRERTVRCLVFSMHLQAEWAQQAFKAGALGYVSKSSEPEQLIEAIRSVARNTRYLSPDIETELALRQLNSDKTLLNDLTSREFEILRLLIAGNEVDAIAETLHLSPKTIRNVHYAVKSKLGVRDDIELMRLAIKLGLVDSPSAEE